MERLPTEIAGLDRVLRGGLVKGGAYLILGQPGTGKTTLGNQIAYAQARQGKAVIFVTVLAESHGRMLAHLSGYHFFDHATVGNRIHYVNVYDELEQDGLPGVLDVIRRAVREHHAAVVVVDGSGLFEDFAASRLAYRRFIGELHATLAALNATLLLLSDDLTGEAASPIGTHVDGLIVLERRHYPPRDVRFLHVLKIRGVPFLEGLHQMRITADGIEVYPRMESLVSSDLPLAEDFTGQRAFGIKGLDDMLHGGLLSGSTTLLLGAPGAGKTLAGLHFLAEGARQGERGLYVGFHETPPRLIGKAEAIGLPLGDHVQRGLIEMLWQPPLELLLDAWAGQILTLVREYRPQRLMIDALTDLTRLALFANRLPSFLAAVTNLLRAENVTTLMAAEADAFVGEDLRVPIPSLSALVENIVLLRYVELNSHLRRLISILKVRETDYDASIREFHVTNQGIEVADTFDSAEAILTGVARRVTFGAAPTARVTTGETDR
jgi:circadian clock protein KaiC